MASHRRTGPCARRTRAQDWVELIAGETDRDLPAAGPGGKSYTFVLVGKPGKYDIVKIEDAVAVQPNQ